MEHREKMKKILALLALGLSVTFVPFTASAHGPSPQKVEKSHHH